jgi:hypothetical protein
MEYDLTTTVVPIADLKPHPNNPRNGDTDAIAESLTANGQYKPIVCAKDLTILAGNHTYAAAMELGYDTFAVVTLPIAPDSAEALRIMLADNRTADLGGYDDSLLLRALADLADTDLGLTGTGYTPETLPDIPDPDTELLPDSTETILITGLTLEEVARFRSQPGTSDTDRFRSLLTR